MTCSQSHALGPGRTGSDLFNLLVPESDPHSVWEHTTSSGSAGHYVSVSNGEGPLGLFLSHYHSSVKKRFSPDLASSVGSQILKASLTATPTSSSSAGATEATGNPGLQSRPSPKCHHQLLVGSMSPTLCQLFICGLPRLRHKSGKARFNGTQRSYQAAGPCVRDSEHRLEGKEL